MSLVTSITSRRITAAQSIGCSRLFMLFTHKECNRYFLTFNMCMYVVSYSCILIRKGLTTVNNINLGRKFLHGMNMLNTIAKALLMLCTFHTSHGAIHDFCGNSIVGEFYLHVYIYIVQSSALIIIDQ